MTFTYNLDSTNTQDVLISKIRLEAGDSAEAPWGLRTDGRNFHDEELLYFYDIESSSIGRAAAHAVEVAATEWGTVAANMRIGEHWEAGNQASNLRSRAKEMRAQYGKTPGARPSNVVQYANARPDTE